MKHGARNLPPITWGYVGWRCRWAIRLIFPPCPYRILYHPHNRREGEWESRMRCSIRAAEVILFELPGDARFHGNVPQNNSVTAIHSNPNGK